jgi:splicing factor U2AF subunit
LIPKPRGKDQHVPGLGKVFVEFTSIVSAANCRSAISGRKFGEKLVKATFLDEAKFRAGLFDDV